MVIDPKKLDLTVPPDILTEALVDIESVSRNERAIADAVEEAIRRQCPGFEVLRTGNAILARTNYGMAERVLFAGHFDTVPVADNLPSARDGGAIYGCGTTDMKSGDAVFLYLAATVTDPIYDITMVFYDCEELTPDQNGIGRILADHGDWLDADVAILGEPTNGVIEGGCQGTLWATFEVAGTRAHSARSWLGVNAVHEAIPVLQKISNFNARVVEVDGCTFREGLQVVDISGGVASNVVPDVCTVTVNFRFAPDRSVDAAVGVINDLFADLPGKLEIVNVEPGARPGSGSALTRALVDAAGGEVVAKLGWTDVSRFAALGIPAVNLGPGDPNLAHTRGEYVLVSRIQMVTEILSGLLTGSVDREFVGSVPQDQAGGSGPVR